MGDSEFAHHEVLLFLFLHSNMSISKLDKKAQKTKESCQRKLSSQSWKLSNLSKCLQPNLRHSSTQVQTASVTPKPFYSLSLSDLPCYPSMLPLPQNRELVQYGLNLIKSSISALLSLHNIFKILQLKAIRERSICVLAMCTTCSYLFEKIKIKQLLLFISLTSSHYKFYLS